MYFMLSVTYLLQAGQVLTTQESLQQRVLTFVELRYCQCLDYIYAHYGEKKWNINLSVKDVYGDIHLKAKWSEWAIGTTLRESVCWYRQILVLLDRNVSCITLHQNCL